MITKGDGGREGKTGSLEWPHAHWYMEWMLNRDLLYRRGNSTQYSVIIYMGKESEKEWKETGINNYLPLKKKEEESPESLGSLIGLGPSDFCIFLSISGNSASQECFRNPVLTCNKAWLCHTGRDQSKAFDLFSLKAFHLFVAGPFSAWP